MTSLRERNRQAAMEHIQDAAFTLFDQHGYEHVTIGQIAQAAEVSESTFYRLFSTKEGLFTATPWEPGSPVLEETELAEDRLPELIRDAVGGNEFRGLAWALTEPAARTAVLAALDSLASQLIDRLVSAGAPRARAATSVRGLVLGVYLTALEEWQSGGRRGAFLDAFDSVLALSGRS